MILGHVDFFGLIFASITWWHLFISKPWLDCLIFLRCSLEKQHFLQEVLEGTAQGSFDGLNFYSSPTHPTRWAPFQL